MAYYLQLIVNGTPAATFFPEEDGDWSAKDSAGKPVYGWKLLDEQVYACLPASERNWFLGADGDSDGDYA